MEKPGEHVFPPVFPPPSSVVNSLYKLIPEVARFLCMLWFLPPWFSPFFLKSSVFSPPWEGAGCKPSRPNHLLISDLKLLRASYYIEKWAEAGPSCFLCCVIWSLRVEWGEQRGKSPLSPCVDNLGFQEASVRTAEALPENLTQTAARPKPVMTFQATLCCA